MANTNLIYTYIQDSGYKLQYVASVPVSYTHLDV